MLFLALLRVDTLVADFLECTEIAFGQVCLPGREGKLFQSNCLTTGFSVPWEGRRVGKLKTRWDGSVHGMDGMKIEQVSLEEFAG